MICVLIFTILMVISLLSIPLHYWYFELYKKRRKNNDENKWFDRY
jgi:hypothetical protein